MTQLSWPCSGWWFCWNCAIHWSHIAAKLPTILIKADPPGLLSKDPTSASALQGATVQWLWTVFHPRIAKVEAGRQDSGSERWI